MKKSIYVDDKYKLAWLIFRVRTLLYRTRDKELTPYDVKPRQAAVLMVAAAIGDKATPAEISRWLLREPHTVSGILDRMEKKGLVNRVKDLERKNMIRVTLTEKGQKAYRAVRKKGVYHKIIGVLTEEEQGQLASLLTKIQEKAIKVSEFKIRPFP